MGHFMNIAALYRYDLTSEKVKVFVGICCFLEEVMLVLHINVINVRYLKCCRH